VLRAGRVLQRGIADLTILGDASQIRARAAELGVNLDDATFTIRAPASCVTSSPSRTPSCAPKRV
jgi:hypothetical protein